MSTTPGKPWIELLRHPQAISSLYTTVPSLSVLYEAVLHRDGPRADVRVELDRYADRPSKRWDESFNRVQVTLRFDDLREIEVKRWGWEGRLTTAHICELNGLVVFHFEGSDVYLRGTSLTIDALAVSAYWAEGTP